MTGKFIPIPSPDVCEKIDGFNDVFPDWRLFEKPKEKMEEENSTDD